MIKVFKCPIQLWVFNGFMLYTITRYLSRLEDCRSSISIFCLQEQVWTNRILKRPNITIDMFWIESEFCILNSTKLIGKKTWLVTCIWNISNEHLTDYTQWYYYVEHTMLYETIQFIILPSRRRWWRRTSISVPIINAFNEMCRSQITGAIVLSRLKDRF